MNFPEQKIDRCYPSEAAPQAFNAFQAAYPTFKQTSILDDWRTTEYGRLDAHKQIYLDYTGGGLYGESQLKNHLGLLANGVYGNPHSNNPTSLAMTHLVEEARQRVLDYFNAGDEYLAIFTLNASGALKLVGEAYPFAAESRYLLPFDNHNSVNGIRQFAQQKGATVTYLPLTRPNLRLDPAQVEAQLARADRRVPNLFAFPAQSNFSGVKHPLSLIEMGKSYGWDVLLDAAAFVPTNPLDLQQVQPDFVSVSFYKMFGYPTGIGALLIHKSAFPRLQRPWFAGGTVNFASVRGKEHILASNEAAFEDGTVNYLHIPAVKIGLDHLTEVGIETVRERVECLTGWLLQQLVSLTHSNGKPMVRVYGPICNEMRGGTVTLNFYDPEGHLLDYRRIEELANVEGISLRTGCFCNPGAGEIAESITAEDVQAGIQELGLELSLPHFLKVIETRGNKSAGAIRVSLGIASNFADVYAFMRFAEGFRDQTNLSIGQVTFDIENCRVIRDGS